MLHWYNSCTRLGSLEDWRCIVVLLSYWRHTIHHIYNIILCTYLKRWFRHHYNINTYSWGGTRCRVVECNEQQSKVKLHHKTEETYCCMISVLQIARIKSSLRWTASPSLILCNYAETSMFHSHIQNHQNTSAAASISFASPAVLQMATSYYHGLIRQDVLTALQEGQSCLTIAVSWFVKQESTCNDTTIRAHHCFTSLMTNIKWTTLELGNSFQSRLFRWYMPCINITDKPNWYTKVSHKTSDNIV